MKQNAPNCSTKCCAAAQFQGGDCFLAISSKNSYKLSIFKPVSFLDMRVIGDIWNKVKGGAVVLLSPLALTTAACAQDDTSANASTSQIETVEAVEEDMSLNPRTEARCGQLYVNQHGNERNAGFSAWEYSRQNIGHVGIAIYDGRDLSDGQAAQLGAALVNSFRNRGVQAECFINRELAENGSGIRFSVAGLSTLAKDEAGNDRSFMISEVYGPGNNDVIELLDSIAAEAKTAGMQLNTAALNENTVRPGTN